jgi:hypothetical protein
LQNEDRRCCRSQLYPTAKRFKHVTNILLAIAHPRGAFNGERMAADYEMVQTYFDLENPFEINAAYTNDFLDTSIKMAE